MDIYWYGQALFKLKGKNATVLIDPFSPDFTGLKLPKDLGADIVLKTHDHEDHSNIKAVTGEPKIFDGPGEYESKGVVVTGVKSFHDNSGGSERGLNTIFNVIIDGIRIAHLGDIGQAELTEAQIEEIDNVDILLVPVGSVYTIDAKGAAGIIAQLEPKMVIPMHYGGVEGLKLPLDPVEKFLKDMGAENVIPVPKLTITKDKLPEETEVVLLSKAN